MRKSLCRIVVACVLLSGASSKGQMPDFPEGERVTADAALDRALKTSSLTAEGKPFHAVVEIGRAAEQYSGRVEVWWAAQNVYKLQVSSPKFSQAKSVNGDKVWEKDEGDYYPRWLENFVLAVLDPIPMRKNFQGRDGVVTLRPQLVRGCIRRDDRPGGITDQMTWGEVCFSGSEPRLSDVLTTNLNLDFSYWKKFGEKQVARTIKTDVEGYEEVTGRMMTLEELNDPDPAMFAVKEVTPPGQRIATQYVSTLTEERMVELKPEIQWPSVREGKTEGYMIVYARTDRTGQVRETSKHNSDQPGLENFGMEAAKRYKFKPLVVNGVPMQMEMPLVLHFTSKLDDPLPTLSVEQMKKQMKGCKVGNLPPGSATVTLKVSVNEKGELTGLGPVGNVQGGSWVAATLPMRSCRFAPYVVDGRVTYYHGLVELTAP